MMLNVKRRFIVIKPWFIPFTLWLWQYQRSIIFMHEWQHRTIGLGFTQAIRYGAIACTWREVPRQRPCQHGFSGMMRGAHKLLHVLHVYNNCLMSLRVKIVVWVIVVYVLLPIISSFLNECRHNVMIAIMVNTPNLVDGRPYNFYKAPHEGVIKSVSMHLFESPSNAMLEHRMRTQSKRVQLKNHKNAITKQTESSELWESRPEAKMITFSNKVTGNFFKH